MVENLTFDLILGLTNALLSFFILTSNLNIFVCFTLQAEPSPTTGSLNIQRLLGSSSNLTTKSSCNPKSFSERKSLYLPQSKLNLVRANARDSFSFLFIPSRSSALSHSINVLKHFISDWLNI